MERSSAIYVVSTQQGVRACFTVKHELITWCKKFNIDGKHPDFASIMRYRDNPGRGNPEIDVGVKIEIN